MSGIRAALSGRPRARATADERGATLVEYAVDRNPYKHGRYTPGTHIPIHPPERIRETRPDYVLILPWNLKDEIVAQLSYVREWGAKFVVPIPSVEVL